MKITTEQELQPFTVPNFVLTVGKTGARQDGFVEGPKYALGELSVETLNALCDKFRDDVLERAHNQRNPKDNAVMLRGGTS
jgi:hypothetical protein